MLTPVPRDITIRLGQDYLQTLALAIPNVGQTPATSPSYWQLITPTAYNSGTTYAAGAYVTSAGVMYISLAGSNTGNTPASSPSWWSAISSSAYNAATSYLAGAYVTDTTPALYLALVGGPIDLTGCTLESQIKQAKNPNSSLLATLTMTILSPPTGGQFTEGLLASAMTTLAAQEGPFFRDLFIKYSGGGYDKIDYGEVRVEPNVTVWQ